MKKFSEWVMALLFSGTLLVLMAATILLPKERYSYYENRNLSAFPEISAESVASGKVFGELETMFCDYAAWRTAALRAVTWCDLNLFHRPVVNEVVVTPDALLEELYTMPDTAEDILREADAVAADNAALRALMTRATDERNARNETMVQRLHDAGYPITMAELRAAFPGQTVLGRPHIAALLVQRGCIPTVSDGMRGLLGRGKRFYVPRYNIPLEDSVRALRAAGGVPVVAHLFKYRFDDAQRTALLAAAADAGALGLEVRYTTYTPEQTAAAQALAGHFGLVPTGGSDYHGLRKPDIALGSGRGGLRVPYAYLAGLKALAGHECV